MQIQILSDTHFEEGIYPLDLCNVDVFIFAGDINTGLEGLYWIKEKIQSVPVIYVLGNHEFYNTSYKSHVSEVRELAQNTNVYFLENNSIEMGEVVIHGCTLWTDFNAMGNAGDHGAAWQNELNDFCNIGFDKSNEPINFRQIQDIHRESVKWLEDSLHKNRGKENVVVTHFAPSLQSVADAYSNTRFAPGFASNLENIISKYQPKLWVHGHTHKFCDYMIGASRILCNPHGPINKPVSEFQDRLVVEI